MPRFIARSTHSLTHPSSPGWDIRPQLNFATLLCPELWPALCPMLDPTPPALWSLFSARWFLTSLFSSSQLGSISRRYWVSCHCDGHPWNMNKPSQPVVHTFRILIQFFISDLVVLVDIADHRPFSYLLSLLSSTQSHTQGEPYQRCNKA